MNATERDQMLVEWNATEAPFPDLCVHQLFEEQVVETPDAIALIEGEQRLTYAALNRRANQVAQQLLALGCQPDDLIAVCIERSAELFIGLLAIMKAGGAYVPLDVGYPAARIDYMLRDSGARILLTTTAIAKQLAPSVTALQDCRLVSLDKKAEFLKNSASDALPVFETLSVDVSPNNLAYCIYTSGSTGNPKGVLMEHRSLVNMLWWHKERRPPVNGVRTLQFCAVSFDFSFHEIFSTLCLGGTLVLAPESIRQNPFAVAQFVKEKQIEKLFLPVTALLQFAEAVDDETIPTALREVITTGEQMRITPAIANLFRQTAALLHNHYGATEFQDATTYTLQGEPANWPTLVPVGTPLHNVQVYILDKEQQPVPLGEEGEFCIGGVGVARGYHNLPDLNAQKFIDNPFAFGRLYCTGDLARYQTLADGTLTIEHLGRIDHQVKIRGFRVELGEIEAVLERHDTVRECAVVAREIAGDTQLVGYVVPGEGVSQTDLETTLRSYLEVILPEYMVPTRFVPMEAMPLTPSGKLDRRALPTPTQTRPTLSTPLVKPKSVTEQRLATIWQVHLGLDSVGVHDNFFELGGTSLLLTQAHKSLRETFNINLSAVALFQYPTIQTLARYIDSQEAIGQNGAETARSQPRKTQATEQQVPEQGTSPNGTSNGKNSTRSGFDTSLRSYSTAAGLSKEQTDIAIIGMAGRFPGADTIEQFWQNLCDGVESITFFQDDELEQTSPALFNNPAYVKAGAVLEGIESFDAAFFGYSPKEAAITDPQQRILLECAWEAFERAGYNPETYPGAVGVYAGSSLSTYLLNNIGAELGITTEQPFIETDMAQFQAKIGNDRSYLATRISYKLNLTGPSVNVQTACSTSLVAVHMACQSLISGECDMALAGGISVVVPHKGGYLYEEGMVRSPDGHCRAFDAEAQGTIFGNGGGLVLLKRLQDALDDNDNIVAVIKGSAVNNDGARKVGYTAPSVDRQADVIREALAAADIDAATICYVEAHGTATKLGDPIEVAGLTQAFQRSTSSVLAVQQCAIGSVKTNIGHLDEAAGIAGLIKAALAVHHGQIPPSLHYSNPNPQIDFETTPFFVNTALRKWASNGHPRRAGVSSFGVGGTNSHVVLEEAPGGDRETRRQGDGERQHHLLTLSAHTEQALDELTQRYIAYCAAHPDMALADLCFTANTGRKHFAHRAALVADSMEKLGSELGKALHAPKVAITTEPGQTIAFLFTGHGGHYVGMGQQLYETEPRFRAAIDECDAIIQAGNYLDCSLLDILYPNPDQAITTALLEIFAYAQPALFAVEYALSQLWISWGVKPDVVMGHSTGEYVAACVAGVFSLADGLKLVCERGRLMQAAQPNGEMVAVSAGEAQVVQLLHTIEWPQPDDPTQQVTLATINSPTSVVLSGTRTALARPCELFTAAGIKHEYLAIPVAAHSPLMAAVLPDYLPITQQVTYALPTCTFISNVTGEVATTEIATPDYWCRHLVQPVRFADGMQTIATLGVNIFVEIGPNPILLGLGRRCLPEHPGLWLPSLRAKRQEWQQILTSLADLYRHGFTIDWHTLYRTDLSRRLRLPTYPFQRKRCWIEAKRAEQSDVLSVPKATNGHVGHPLLGLQLIVPGIRETLFRSSLSRHQPRWMNDHLVFQAIIVPGVAYLEIVLAAGATLLATDKLQLEEITIRQAMILPENAAAKTVQITLQPEDQGVYFCQIYSLEDETSGDWILHATSKLVVNQASAPESIELEKRKTNYTHEISADLFHQRGDGQEIVLGPSFWTAKELWQDGNGCLGRIEFPAQFLPELAEYQLHPLLVEGCFTTLLAAAYPQTTTGTSNYVPTTIQRLQFFGWPTQQRQAEVWCEAKLQPNQGTISHTLSGDIDLFTADGHLIASFGEVLFQKAAQHTMIKSTTPLWQEWLHQVVWTPSKQAQFVQQPEGKHASDTWLIVTNEAARGHAVAKELASKGVDVTLLETDNHFTQIDERHYTIDAQTPADYERVLCQLPNLQKVLYLGEADTPQEHLSTHSQHHCVTVLYLVQTLLKLYPVPPQIWLITTDAQAVVERDHLHGLAQSSLWGMGRVIQQEYPELGCTCLDIDVETSSQALVDLLLTDAHAVDAANPTQETQLALRHGERYVAHLVRTLKRTNAALPPEPFHLEITEFGNLNQLHWRPATRRAPAVDEVEIRVYATGLNFLDIFKALGLLPQINRMLGDECVGEIVAVGADVTRFAVGDVVVALANDCFGSYVTANQAFVVHKPANLCPQAAATIPTAFLTAYSCLHHLAHIQAGDRVLIHAASGGVGMAAVQLAQQVGAEVFATASPGKWEKLRELGVQHIYNSRTLDFGEQIRADTNGLGVDIVLNSLTSEGFIAQSLSLLTPQGHFLEIAKRGVWSSEQMAAARPDVGYHQFDLDVAMRQTPALIQQWLSTIVEQCGNGLLQPLPYTEFAAHQLVAAFRYMQQAKHVGKIIVTLKETHGSPIRADGTYFITGGLGGLGLQVARWFVEQGARHLVLLGRSQPSLETRTVLEELRASGSEITVAQADVCDATAMASLLTTLAHPLRGVIHAAGVIDDASLHQQSINRFSRVLAPKVQGAWNLHQLTRDLPLDFFVLFSSVTSILGTAGQVSYAAANAFLDGLAAYRQHLGLPALSINWGSWSEVGMTARLDLVDQLAQKGEGVISPQEGVVILDRLLQESAAQISVMPVDWPRFLMKQGSRSAFYKNFFKLAGQSFAPKAVPVTNGPENFRQIIEQASSKERPVLIEEHLRQQIAEILGVATSDLSWEANIGFVTLGMDSLTSIELRNRLQRTLECSLPLTFAFDYPTTEKAVAYLSEKLQLAHPNSPQPVVVPASKPSSGEAPLLTLPNAEASSADDDDTSLLAIFETLSKQLQG